MSAREYPEHFGVVEVQQTFYQPPAPRTMLRWRESMPSGFEFSMKAWQLVTHAATSSTYRRMRRPLTAEERAGLGGFRPTAIVDEGWRTTLECARILRASTILFQCPASFRPTEENVTNLRGFFRRIDRPAGVRLAWEPRGPWPEALLRQLCGELELVHVVDPFVTPNVTRDPVYFRVHGVTGSRHVHSDAELRRLLAMLPDDGVAYVMFNNLPRVGDALRFLRLLREAAPLQGARASS